MNYRAISFAVFVAIVTAFSVPVLYAARTAGEKPKPTERNHISLRLVGTALAEDPSESIAVIESGENGLQRSYSEGDLVVGLRIKKILRNRVVFQTSWGEEAITMSRSLFSESESRVSQEDSEPIAHGPRPPETRMHDTRYLDRKSVASALTDIDAIIRTARIETVSVYGKPVGIKITPVESGSIFSNIGLKNGEVIQEVNGESIIHPEQAIAIFRQLKAGDDVDIKVKGRRTRRIHLILE